MLSVELVKKVPFKMEFGASMMQEMCIQDLIV